MRAVIFANGEIRDAGRLRDFLRADDWIIAADGGARHCRRLGLKPAVLIGDLDSLTPAEARRREKAGVTLIPFPEAKDQTDLELALAYAIDHGADEIVILGGLGRRWDQTVGNLLLPAAERYARVPVRLLDGDDEIEILRGPNDVILNGTTGDVVSLIPLSDQAEGITTSGLAYPLRDESLPLGSTRGISNVLTGESCQISLRRGILLCFHSRRNHRTHRSPSSRTKARRGPERQRRTQGRRLSVSAERGPARAPARAGLKRRASKKERGSRGGDHDDR